MPGRTLPGCEWLADVPNRYDGQHEENPNAITPTQIVGDKVMALSASIRTAGVTPAIISDVGYPLGWRRLALNHAMNTGRSEWPIDLPRSEYPESVHAAAA